MEKIRKTEPNTNILCGHGRIALTFLITQSSNKTNNMRDITKITIGAILLWMSRLLFRVGMMMI